MPYDYDSPGDYESSDNASYASGSSGNYSIDTDTGLYTPKGTPPRAPQQSSPSQLNDMVRSLMTGYLRKQVPAPGQGYIPYTTAAPADFQDAFKPLDRYSSYGIPYQGIGYGSTPQRQGVNPYSVIFGTGGGSGSGGGY